jgi:hypothetical protein
MRVRIYQPARNTMQSGKGRTKYWVLQYLEPVKREADPLMGWTSSDNTQQQVNLRFDTKEEAVAYAQREGFAYVVEEPRPQRLQVKTYADNFRYDRVGRWTH